MPDRFTGIILAGGKSSRMGMNKSFISFQGKTLIEHSISLMQRICDEVIISANDKRYETFGIPVIPDNIPSIGPMGGIEATLSHTRTKHNLFIPGDTPFLTPGVYYELVKNAYGIPAVIPLTASKQIEPLIAYYSKELLVPLHGQIGKRNYKIQDLLQQSGYKGINIDSHGALRNLNTEAELEMAAKSNKQIMDNMILIAGNGRNVGKTYLACEIIKHLSLSSRVVGIKISPHFHDVSAGSSVLYENERFIIVYENATTMKDSSLMLHSGAKKVFFIMGEQEHLEEALSLISNELEDHAIVCESGGLAEMVRPGLFLFVKSKDEHIQKMHLLEHVPIIVNNDHVSFDFDLKRIGYRDNQITLDLQFPASRFC